MRQHHVAGEKAFVDYSGKRIGIADPKTGEIREAERPQERGALRPLVRAGRQHHDRSPAAWPSPAARASRGLKRGAWAWERPHAAALASLSAPP